MTGGAPPGDPFVRGVLERIATGPELSRDLPREEAREATARILAGDVDPVQAGIFLIALRMKRETDDEMLGVLDAVLAAAAHAHTVARDDVVVLADPFDGCNRHLPLSPFLPAVLAACGVATVALGAEPPGPKFGATPAKVLATAGVSIGDSVEHGAARLDDADTGWCYLDQAVACPALATLRPLRSLIVKRPALTTVEGLVCPLRGRARTHLVTGYVHRAYPRIYALLARAAGFDSLLLVKGVEAGVIPPMNQPGRAFVYHDRGDEREIAFTAAQLGIEHVPRAVPLPEGVAGFRKKDPNRPPDIAAIAAAAAEAGLAALDGAPGPAREALVYAAALALAHVDPELAPATAAERARAALDGGEAAARFSAALRE